MAQSKLDSIVVEFGDRVAATYRVVPVFGSVGSPTWVFDGGRAKLYGNFDFAVLHATVEHLLAGLDAGCSDC